MAKDAVDNAVFIGKLPKRPCVTDTLRIHGWQEKIDPSDPLHHYGADADGIRALVASDASLDERLHPDHPFIRAEEIWACRHELACTVEDVLARRLRLLFLDARAAMEVAPAVAKRMGAELGLTYIPMDFNAVAGGVLP